MHLQVRRVLLVLLALFFVLAVATSASAPYLGVEIGEPTTKIIEGPDEDSDLEVSISVRVKNTTERALAVDLFLQGLDRSGAELCDLHLNEALKPGQERVFTDTDYIKEQVYKSIVTWRVETATIRRGQPNSSMNQSVGIRYLEDSCHKFLARYDRAAVQRDYPRALEDLSADTRDEQLRGIQVLGATGELYVLPWLVPLIDAEDSQIRVIAGLSIERIVTSVLLKRRDPTQNTVVIKPPAEGEIDLQPLSWVALKMIRSGDPNLSSYGATMAAYLGRADFEQYLRGLLQSIHPAVRNHAKYALTTLGLEKQESSDEPKEP